MEHIIKTQSLSFGYGKKTILKDIHLSVPQNSIYGFLGPNGAGKSTTIKVLLGLLRVPAEHVFLFDQDIRKQRISILSRIGSLIESPSIYSHLTALDNLKVAQTLYPQHKNRLEEVLELVGLKQAARKKVKHFSMGMKQRLGIGVALFHDPELLILDEPVNGLDPSGIHEMRQLFLRLQEQGKTVFISSHLLSEIEKTCTHLGIIKEGELIFQGEIGEMQSSTRRTIKIKTEAVEMAKNKVSETIENVIIEDGLLNIDISDDQHFDQVMKALVAAEIPLLDMERTSPSLEDLFIDLTGN